jgi:transcription initiation factor TFIIH subunit 1
MENTRFAMVWIRRAAPLLDDDRRLERRLPPCEVRGVTSVLTVSTTTALDADAVAAGVVAISILSIGVVVVSGLLFGIAWLFYNNAWVVGEEEVSKMRRMQSSETRDSQDSGPEDLSYEGQTVAPIKTSFICVHLSISNPPFISLSSTQELAALSSTSHLQSLILGSMVERTASVSFSVVFKKAEGKLTLSDDGLRFQHNEGTTNSDSSGAVTNMISWSKVSKHQVSPANHPKALLKIVLVEGAGKPLIFQFTDRPDMEVARKDVTQRLQHFQSQHHSSLSSPVSLSGTKRRHNDMSFAAPTAATTVGETTGKSFGELDPTSLAVTRSSLLAANPTLRAQHQYLVLDSRTVDEEDFWETHRDLLEEEYARIAGITRAGTSSLLQSHLSTLTGRITLGVEEMRQIFIMYPAVHKAYEEKVPLELSDEQFWRKYLESEYFHRDRGKIGAASRKKDDAAASNGKNGKTANSKRAEEARAAAVGTDDLFSRYDQKLRESGQLEDGVFGTGLPGDGTSGNERARHKKWGTKLAIGQFDLASTFETERGKLLEGPRDNHPVDPEDDGKGAKVIQKYNRHWAMVLNPEDAVAGSNLMEVARKSVEDTVPDDDDAKAGGGVDDEMQRLVGFANASSGEANHALGMGETDEYVKLTLKNIEVYHSGRTLQANAPSADVEAKIRKDSLIYANVTAKRMRALVATRQNASSDSPPEDAFPPPALGKTMMVAMSKKFVVESKTDADTLEVVNALPEDFKKRLYSYFRRASELLRHFFGLNRLVEECPENMGYRQKLSRINDGIKVFYEEVKSFRDNLDNLYSPTMGVTMRKMTMQIMDQVDFAFKNAEKDSGSGGGFVTVETF